MFKKVLLGIAVVGLVFAGVAYADESQDVTVEFEGRYWFSDLDAEGKVVESSIGTDFDFESDLGVGEEDFPEGRVIWHTGPNSRVRFAYTDVEYSGDINITRDIQFGGKTYNVGARVESSLDVTYLRLGWIWQFINLAEDTIKLGGLLEVKGILADIALSAPSLSISESEEFVGAAPTIGVTLDINPIEKINLFSLASQSKKNKICI